MENQRKKKIAFYTLGCKVNQYETQGLKEKFAQLGYELVEEQDFADVYVVNTCTVTGLSDRKSRQYIRRTKRINPDSITAVIGCYAQVSPDEVTAIEGVDIVAGTNEKQRLPEFVETCMASRRASDHSIACHVLDYGKLGTYEETGTITSMESRTRAFIKIQEGCNRFCSYCIIPYARGTLRSRGREEIVKEAKSLLEKGFKELVLTGINTALYGMEPGFLREEGESQGVELIIKELNDLPGDFRIRLSSLEPTVVDTSYVAGLTKYEKLCPHLHLSLQSGSDNVLSDMNRRYSCEDYMAIVKTLKAFDPNFGITTDIIVGFPGETEADFRDTLDMVKGVGFCKVHVFKYSKRKGTKAADMKGQTAPEVKARRSAALIGAGEREAAGFFMRNAETTRRVLFEEYDERTECWRGHTDNFIEVYCESGADLANTFADVTLEEPYLGGMKGTLQKVD